MPSRQRPIFADAELDAIGELLRVAQIVLLRAADDIDVINPNSAIGERLRRDAEQACDFRERIERR